MKTRIEFELETLRDSLRAGADALAVIERETGGLTRYGNGMRDAYEHIIEWLDRIMEVIE